MTPQEFNTTDKMIRSDFVNEVTRQASASIESMKKDIPLPSMPQMFTPNVQKPQDNPSYLIVLNGQQNGPYTKDQLREMLSQGFITIETLVWKSGMPDWQPIKNIPEFI